jgi:hypothetical protein
MHHVHRRRTRHRDDPREGLTGREPGFLPGACKHLPMGWPGVNSNRKLFQANNTSALPALKLFMLQFVCDYCENVKLPEEVWINGIAAENVGTQAARREVIIDPAWRRERAVLPFAVHFCSVECKEGYLAELFNKPAALLEVQSAGVEAGGQRVVRAKKKPLSNAAQTRTTTHKKTRVR